ncbi:MAG TPA: sigma-70 family RNA polymerase sigma factor [Candidatus Binataceae bacterium]|nr:sigma-70 family RNA polymerase sigma factor [Candidatus Binataceae bacterium]
MSSAGRPEDDEQDLVRRAKHGDREAFGVLVQRYQQRVVGVARALVHNPDDAVELGQETFIRAFQNLKSFEGRSSFSTWLYRIASNLAIDWRRRESRYMVAHGEEAENELRKIPSGEGDSFRALARDETSRKVREALKELTAEHRQVILLREMEGLSYEEISDILSCPKGTVMSRLHYARSHLRDLLKDVEAS